MNRATLNGLIYFAGYHEDTATGTRLLIENRISRAAYDLAFNAGRDARKSGQRCACTACVTAAAIVAPVVVCDPVEQAIGRIFAMGARASQPGDLAEYDRCRAIVMAAAR